MWYIKGKNGYACLDWASLWNVGGEFWNFFEDSLKSSPPGTDRPKVLLSLNRKATEKNVQDIFCSSIKNFLQHALKYSAQSDFFKKGLVKIGWKRKLLIPSRVWRSCQWREIRGASELHWGEEKVRAVTGRYKFMLMGMWMWNWLTNVSV